MDKISLVVPPPRDNRSILTKYPRLIFSAQIIFTVIVVAIFAVLWHWNREREIPRQTMATSSQEDLEDITTDFHVSRLPYSEDTIVNIISDIYRIYLQLNYVSDWEVSWAPQEGHNINQALCEQLHLDPIVISLMKRLPYFRFSGISGDIEFIYPYSRAFVYLEDYEIRGGRDPDRFEFDEPRTDFLLPHEIALTCSMDEGIHVILDVKENTIRVWDFHDSPPNDDYRKCHPYHAPTYLASYLQRVRSLEILPSMTRYPRDLFTKDRRVYDLYPKIKKIIQEQYGWPYDFREAEWRAVSKVTWQRIIREDPTYETDNDDELEPEVLKGGKDDKSFYLWPGR